MLPLKRFCCLSFVTPRSTTHPIALSGNQIPGLNPATVIGFSRKSNVVVKPKRRGAKSMLTSIKSLSLKDTNRITLLIAFGAGFCLGRYRQLPRYVPRPGSVSRSYFLLRSVLVLALVREIWRSTPIWIKRQLPFIRRRYHQVAVDTNDLSSLQTIGTKLQSVLNLAQTRMASQEIVVPNPQIYFAVLVRTLTKLKPRMAATRNDRYERSGAQASPTRELLGIDEMFEFADWAYDELPGNKPLTLALREHGFSLLRHDKIAEPGSVAHYIAISKQRKEVLVGVKGSSNFEDLLTDCCLEPINHELEDVFVVGGPRSIDVHDGILVASTKLLSELDVLVEALILPSDYKIIITGHSLGASVAAVLGILLRSRFPQLRVDDERLKVWAFASPPCLDLEASLASHSFTTTVVNNADVIPRWSLPNLLIVMKVLQVVYSRMNSLGMTSTGWKLTRSFVEIMTNETSSIMTDEEISSAMDVACNEIELKNPDHLYVPGRVLHLYDLWSDVDGLKDVDSNSTKLDKRLVVSNATSSALRYVEFDGRMLTDHLSPAYRSSIRHLLDDDNIESD